MNKSLAIKLLERIDDGNTLLFWACENKMEKLAMKILENIDECNIGHIAKDGYTALMHACENKMDLVGSSGGISVFDTITSAGDGGGGSIGTPAQDYIGSNGANGGSGGGGGQNS